MRLVDTSAWIEWLVGSPVGQTLAPEMPERTEWLVPTIVQLELAKWLTREVGEDKADQVVAFTQTCVVADLDTAIALSAADLWRPAKARDRGRHRLCDRAFARRRAFDLRPAFRRAARGPVRAEIAELTTARLVQKKGRAGRPCATEGGGIADAVT